MFFLFIIFIFFLLSLFENGLMQDPQNIFILRTKYIYDRFYKFLQIYAKNE